MANEITLNASLEYDDGATSPVSVEIINKLVTQTTVKKTCLTQEIGTSEEAIILGDVSAVGYVFFINRDVTNFINLKVGTGGAIFGKLFPGEFACLRLGSGAQVPYAIADTAACKMDIVICAV